MARKSWPGLPSRKINTGVYRRRRPQSVVQTNLSYVKERIPLSKPPTYLGMIWGFKTTLT